MMFDYTLHLSESQMVLLFWIYDGCPADKHPEQMQFIRNASKLLALNLIVHQRLEHDPYHTYRITEKGELLVWFLKLEIEDRQAIAGVRYSNP